MSGCPFLPQMSSPVDDKSTARPPLTPPSGNPFNILGFQAANPAHFLPHEPAGSQEDLTVPQPTHYGNYLGIDQLLHLQDGPAGAKEGGRGLVHHEELTFIIVHQVFELWFKLVAADIVKARGFLIDIAEGRGGDNASIIGMMAQCVTYLRRSESILQHATGAFGIMETMHPADFIEFRDFLVPASGFQSVSFRSLEQLLGVPNGSRAKVNGAEVFSYLQPQEQAQLAAEAQMPSVEKVVTRILCKLKVPDNFVSVYLAANRLVLEEQQFVIARAPKDDPKARALVESGAERMQSMLEDPLAWSEGLVLSDEESADYKQAVLAALFVISYRHENCFASLAALLDSLIAVEEGTLIWRSRHVHMAERMIGRRSGTGGTGSGVGYLDVTRRYRIFHALWLVRKLFIRASALPPFSSYGLESGLSFE